MLEPELTNAYLGAHLQETPRAAHGMRGRSITRTTDRTTRSESTS